MYKGYSHDSISHSYSNKHTIPNFSKNLYLTLVQCDVKIYFIGLFDSVPNRRVRQNKREGGKILKNNKRAGGKFFKKH